MPENEYNPENDLDLNPEVTAATEALIAADQQKQAPSQPRA